MMTPEHASTRARDVDRNATVDLIDAAYGDGQLTAPEREHRNGRALQAATLGELERLTHDLQPVPVAAPVVVRRRRTGLAIGALVLLVGGVGTFVALSGDDEPAPEVSAAVEEPAAAEEAPRRVDEPKVFDKRPFHYQLTEDGIRGFIETYREEFGTTEAAAFGFSRNEVVIAKKSKTGPRQWSYLDGKFLDRGPDDEHSFPPGKVDLTDLDVAALFRNLEGVKDATGLASFPTLGITVVVDGDIPGAYVVAGDKDTPDCLGWWTTMDGEVLQDDVPCGG